MAGQQKSDEEIFAERGFGMRIGFGEKPAVIVIDVINAFTDPDMMLGANLDAKIAETKQVLNAKHADVVSTGEVVQYLQTVGHNRDPGEA